MKFAIMISIGLGLLCAINWIVQWDTMTETGRGYDTEAQEWFDHAERPHK